MRWNEFLSKLLKDFRTSPYTLDKENGISQVGIHQILNGQTKKPRQGTIKKLEMAFGIRIYDSDPTNLSYSLEQSDSRRVTREMINRDVDDIPERSFAEVHKVLQPFKTGSVPRKKFHTYKLKGKFDKANIRRNAYE